MPLCRAMENGLWEIRTDLRDEATARVLLCVYREHLLKTSRTQVDRLLNAKDDITLSSLQRAAAMVGRRVIIELV
jgi:antitoxin HicB